MENTSKRKNKKKRFYSLNTNINEMEDSSFSLTFKFNNVGCNGPKKSFNKAKFVVQGKSEHASFPATKHGNLVDNRHSTNNSYFDKKKLLENNNMGCRKHKNSYTNVFQPNSAYANGSDIKYRHSRYSNDIHRPQSAFKNNCKPKETYSEQIRKIKQEDESQFQNKVKKSSNSKSKAYSIDERQDIDLFNFDISGDRTAKSIRELINTSDQTYYGNKEGKNPFSDIENNHKIEKIKSLFVKNSSVTELSKSQKQFNSSYEGTSNDNYLSSNSTLYEKNKKKKDRMCTVKDEGKEIYHYNDVVDCDPINFEDKYALEEATDNVRHIKKRKRETNYNEENKYGSLKKASFNDKSYIPVEIDSKYSGDEKVATPNNKKENGEGNKNSINKNEVKHTNYIVDPINSDWAEGSASIKNINNSYTMLTESQNENSSFELPNKKKKVYKVSSKENSVHMSIQENNIDSEDASISSQILNKTKSYPTNNKESNKTHVSNKFTLPSTRGKDVPEANSSLKIEKNFCENKYNLHMIDSDKNYSSDDSEICTPKLKFKKNKKGDKSLNQDSKRKWSSNDSLVSPVNYESPKDEFESISGNVTFKGKENKIKKRSKVKKISVDDIKTINQEIKPEHFKISSSIFKRRKRKNSHEDNKDSQDQENGNKKKQKRSSVFAEYVQNLDVKSISDENKLSVVEPEIFLDSEDYTDDEQKLRQLTVNLTFPIPPLHAEATRPSGLTKEQMENIANLNIPITSGPFSKAEDNKILENWKQFCKEYDVKMNPSIFINFPKRMRMKTKINILRYLGHGIDNRLLHRIYIRFQHLLRKGDIKTGRFSPDEDNTILQFMEATKSNSPFKHLSELLHRTRSSIEIRYDRLTSNNRTIHWTSEMIDRFIKNLMKITKCDKIKQLRKKEITKKEWRKLSKKLDKIEVTKLQRAWNVTIYPQLFAKEVDRKEIKKEIIHILHNRNETDWRTINWREIAKNFKGFTSEKIYIMFKQFVHFHVPKDKREDLKECLDFLRNTILKLDKYVK